LAGAGLAGLAAGGLSGCGELLRPEPPQLYTLSPKSIFDEPIPTVDWQLLVEPPGAAAGLDTPRIAVRQEPTTIDYFAGVAWTDRAPLMVQTLMIESFENSDRIVSIGRQSLGLRADFILKSELRELQAEVFQSGLPVAHVAINAKLVRANGRNIIAGETFAETYTASSNDIGAVVLALDEALNKVLEDLVNWTLRRGQENWEADPPRA
jgi:cholesterol transport system auxiliary component